MTSQLISDARSLSKKPEKRSLARRVASAAIVIPLLVLLVWVGGAAFSILVAIAAGIGALELSAMARRWGDHPFPAVAIASAVALVVAGYFWAQASPAWTRALPAIGIATGLSLLWLLWHAQRKIAPLSWAVTGSVALYAGGLLLHAPLLRAVDQGREWVLFLLLVTFAADTCAFLAGRTFGKRPLAPSISPSKTWEGSLGGLVGAIGIGIAAISILSLDATLPKALAMGAVMGTAGQLGDLVESRLKRSADVKDSGWLLPGHGGILDRLDSIVFNLVVMYYFVS